MIWDFLVAAMVGYQQRQTDKLLKLFEEKYFFPQLETVLI
jgi:hypothetical protein